MRRGFTRRSACAPSVVRLDRIWDWATGPWRIAQRQGPRSAALDALLRHDRPGLQLAAAQRLDLHGPPDLVARQDAHEVIRARDLGAVKADDDVARLEACAVGRAVRLDRCDHDGALLGQPGRISEPARQSDLLRRDADKGAPHPG